MFRPAALGYYDPEDPLHATSSLPRDYYYLQQQQLKNKVSSRSLLSKFSSTNSDNRIHPEAGAGAGHSVLGTAAVITSQPLPAGEIPPSLFDPGQGQAAHHHHLHQQLQPSSPLFVELKRAIISQNTSHNQNSQFAEEDDPEDQCPQCEEEQIQYLAETLEDLVDNPEQEEEEEDDNDNDIDEELEVEQEHRVLEDQHSAYVGGATSEPDICAAARQLPRIHHIAIDDIAGQDYNGISAHNSHADFREIECERLRRKCVSVKRIYSISEKF